MAKGKKQFKIETPRGTISTYKVTKGNLKGRTIARLEWNPGFKPDKEKGFADAQEFVDSGTAYYGISDGRCRWLNTSWWANFI